MPVLPPLPSGWPPLDQRLGGGWPAGELTEILGRGRSTLALAAVRRAQAAGQPVAWVDGARTFCPSTAAVDLQRLVLVRPPEGGGPRREGARRTVARVLLAADLLLRSRAFGLLVLDLPAGRGTLGTWFWLARQAQRSGSCLLLLTPGAGAVAGSAAALTVRVALRPPRCARWEVPPPPSLDVTLLRRRGAAAAGRLLLDPVVPLDPSSVRSS